MQGALAVDRYRQTHVRSSTPLELVVMLYEGALQRMAIARDALVRRDIPTRRDAISRTLAILDELQGSLDLERGGQIASELDRLYAWMSGRLMDAAIAQDPAPIDEVRPVLEGLRDAWQTIASAPPGNPRP